MHSTSKPKSIHRLKTTLFCDELIISNAVVRTEHNQYMNILEVYTFIKILLNTLLETSNAPFIILPIYSMIIL